MSSITADPRRTGPAHAAPAAGRVPVIALPTAELRDRLASGALRAEEVARAFIAQVAEREPQVRAFAWFDEDDVIAQARRLDSLRATGRPVGPLHGLPVALKDVIDTARIPTCNGTELDAGRVPERDAWLVTRLRAAGAVIFGKTETAELAFLHPGRTANPVNPDHTPGGSSQGSAAAVAARMVPLAVGTQTGGSVVRPAAYCGCVGFKPSFGAIPRTGVLRQSESLDTVGVFAGDVAGAALLAEVLYGDDPGDPATAPGPAPRLSDSAAAAPPVTPTLALLRLPEHDQASAETREAFAELAEVLGDGAFPVDLPPLFAGAAAERERVNYAEMARNYWHYRKRGADRLSPQMTAALDAGEAITARDYLAARDWPSVLRAGLDEVLDRCDALVLPATPGPAPRGHDTTGPSTFNTLFTFCGMPAITLPLLESPDGLPMGVQLAARRGDDARLLRTAAWLTARLAAAQSPESPA